MDPSWERCILTSKFRQVAPRRWSDPHASAGEPGALGKLRVCYCHGRWELAMKNIAWWFYPWILMIFFDVYQGVTWDKTLVLMVRSAKIAHPNKNTPVVWFQNVPTMCDSVLNHGFWGMFNIRRGDYWGLLEIIIVILGITFPEIGLNSAWLGRLFDRLLVSLHLELV